MVFLFSQVKSFDIEKISEFSQSEYYPITINKVLIQDNYLYSAAGRSLQIFEIQDENIDLITDFEMQGELRYIAANDNYVYAATGGATSRLYRLNISNPYLPVITDTIFFLGNYSNFTDGNYVFVNELHLDAT